MVEEINLGPKLHVPRWNGKPIHELEDHQLIQILRALKKLAILKQRASVWAFSELLDNCGSQVSTYLEEGKRKTQNGDWLEYVDMPAFGELEEELNHRDCAGQWDINEPVDKEIDLSNRGLLERQVVGALRDCVNAHGPITRDLANSAAKRVIGAIKTFNRKVRKQ